MTRQIQPTTTKYSPKSSNTFPHQSTQSHNSCKKLPHHISSSTKELTNYVQNLVRVLDYTPELQFSIWQLIIESSIKLDVELQNELDDLDDEEIEDLISGEEDSDSEDEWEVTTTSIKSLLSKLDSIISTLLTTTANSFTIEELNNGNGVNLFNTINSLFKSHILPTHFTKLIQFILFHITQFQPELADSYLVLLIDVAFNPSEILEKRLKAMQYLSSYIARAKTFPATKSSSLSVTL